MSAGSPRCYRRSIHRPGRDYIRPGAYFITIQADAGLNLFGKIAGGRVVLNRYGMAVKKEWLKTAALRKNIRLDGYIVMPDHFHGIILIPANGAKTVAPVKRLGKPVPKSIPAIVQSFKSASSQAVNLMRRQPGAAVWQRSSYKQVIRNKNELQKIRMYIADHHGPHA